MKRKYIPERISSHPLLTPDREKELDALAKELNTPEAKAESQREIEEVLKEINLQNRVQRLEEEVRELKEKLEALATK